ncbi:hypothetical protein EJ04DRAFT_509523 [Polyplosphaeria fusca]|uniref:Uncharacterized protein n=1 Tax=Polyplosphaeria fusca TaxID=682080 RepID=A0A9P4V5D6_9PLEO|nr:hypothetical protein EJ04DRAFT_509523 [Polyplosphaeria fusca]
MLCTARADLPAIAPIGHGLPCLVLIPALRPRSIAAHVGGHPLTRLLDLGERRCLGRRLAPPAATVPFVSAIPSAASLGAAGALVLDVLGTRSDGVNAVQG